MDQAETSPPTRPEVVERPAAEGPVAPAAAAEPVKRALRVFAPSRTERVALRGVQERFEQAQALERDARADGDAVLADARERLGVPVRWDGRQFIEVPAANAKPEDGRTQ